MKLDSLSIPVRAGESVVRLAWILVFALIGSPTFGGVSGFATVVVGGFVIALAYQLVYYQRFDYELTEETLDIASGVISRRNREIPIGRVQNVDISRNVVQRALGVAQINLETAGGSSTEASLRYVSFEEAKRLQSEIGRLKRGNASETMTEPSPERELFAVSRKELVLLGIIGIDLRLLSIVTVVLPVISPSLRERFGDPLVGLAVTAPLAAAAIVALAALVSGVLALTNYYGFRLARRNDELLYERGLFQRFSGTIPLEKVQTLTVSENVIARALGYASLAVETAGYAPSDEGSQSAVPLADRRRVFDLARSIESFDDISFERPPKRARERYIVRYGIVASLAIAVSFAADRYTGLTFAWYVTLALLPLAVVAAHLKWVNLGYDVQSEYVVLREGFWTRTITVVPYYRVQTVLDSQTIFQRGRRLSSLVVDTAGSSGITNRQPRALDVDDDRAAELRETVADRLQETVRRRRSQRRKERLRSIEAELHETSGEPV
ncbi:MAG: PH domain-containing protein [Natronomonas sp.]|uniref:PH domain-containing protein n=1 Tax=Natronomonas sp. TaxID=2184060 RepID=UPI002870225D|nr:PH domain-containing protein [Natronomonas sp.]MDR9429113.1 PH domain-containing protein [Natronomonas sp.]